jgi:hypothetical protein
VIYVGLLCWIAMVVGYTLCSMLKGISVGSTFTFEPKRDSYGQCMKDPLVLVYNRIPKAGSTTLMSLVKKLSVENDFTMLTPEPYFRHDKLLLAIFDAIKSRKRTLIVNHFFFPELLYNDQVSYMNMMRDPVSRTVSDFYYLRSVDARGNRAVSYSKEHGDISIDECYSGTTEYSTVCEIPGNYQTSFFCGREGHPCHNDVRMKETLGLQNMKQHYRVGIEERYEETLAMLEQSYPRFFKGISSIYKGLRKTSLNANKHPSASDRVVERIKSLNKVDYSLYSKANESLTLYLHTCNM